MKKTLRISLFGISTWLVPFITAFFFYNQEGQISIDLYLFKTIMLLVGNIFGIFMLIVYFKKITENIIREGILVGFAWLAINYLLDFIILLPMSGMEIGDYFMQIGLRYLILPAISFGMGYVIEKHKN